MVIYGDMWLHMLLEKYVVAKELETVLHDRTDGDMFFIIDSCVRLYSYVQVPQMYI